MNLIKFENYPANISKATVIPIAKGATETEEVSTAHVRIVWAKIAVKINSTIAA